MTLSPLRLRLIIGSLLSVSFLGALDHTIVATSLATVAGELGALEQMSWVIVAYTLASTVLLPVMGALGDSLGPKRVFLTALVLFLAASLACGLAETLPQLIVARVVQGMSSAGVGLMSQTIVVAVTSPRQRPRVLSIIGAAFPIAILIGPLLGGVITDLFGWQWVFWVNLPVGLVALVFATITLPAVPGVGRRGFDSLGAVVFAIAMVSLVLGATWLPAEGLSPATSIALGIAGVAFVVFVFVELRATSPLIPLGAFRMRTVSASVALSAIIGIGLLSVVSYIPTYVQMAYQTSATASGIVPIATVLGMLASNLATGWFVSRNGRYRPFPIVGCALSALGLTAMALLPPGLPLWVPTVVMAVVGIGSGAFMSLVVAIAQSAVPRSSAGAITATMSLSGQVGSTVGSAVIGGLIGSGVAATLSSSLNAGTLTPDAVKSLSPAHQADVALAYSDVFAPVFAVLAVVYALGVVAALILPNNTLSDEPVDIPEPAASPA